MRLIDADALENEVKRAHLIFEDGTENIGYTAVYLGSAVRNAPTIEPKKGEWIKITEYDEDVGMTFIFNCCSCCNMRSITKRNFCPDCGADMKTSSWPHENDGKMSQRRVHDD